jgi:hypothetical protein
VSYVAVALLAALAGAVGVLAAVQWLADGVHVEVDHEALVHVIAINGATP